MGIITFMISNFLTIKPGVFYQYALYLPPPQKKIFFLPGGLAYNKGASLECKWIALQGDTPLFFQRSEAFL